MNDALTRRGEHLATVAMPVLKKVYEEQGANYENILIPVNDGRRGFNVSVNLKKTIENEGMEIIKQFSRIAVLVTIDEKWKEQLREMDDLKQSVQNASYEQKDPLLIYKFESFELFKTMVSQINVDVIGTLLKANIPVAQREAQPREAQAPKQQDMSKMQTSRNEAALNAGSGERSKPAPAQAEKATGRNEPCPCGSGKKYKQCHGK